MLLEEFSRACAISFFDGIKYSSVFLNGLFPSIRRHICLEARAAGVPVIASDVPGIRAVIEPGRDGLLVPPGDPQALADAMREFVLHRFPRRVPAGLPMELEAHTDVVEALYARARTARAARPGAPRP